MIAYGIKLSIDNGFAGDVVLEAKITSLARHYEKEFGAVSLSVFDASAPRYLIADKAAKRIFFTYLLRLRRCPWWKSEKKFPFPTRNGIAAETRRRNGFTRFFPDVPEV